MFRKERKNRFVVKKNVGIENVTTITYELVGESQLPHDTYRWGLKCSIVVSLIDVSNGIYAGGVGTAKYRYYFSSPNINLMNDKDRLKSGSGIDIYMGLWSLEESIMANILLQLKISDSEIEDRFYKFGGSARAILDKPELADNFLSKAIISLECNTSLTQLLSMSPEILASSFSHSLFHVTIVDLDFTVPKYQWASVYIKQLVAGVALKEMTYELEGIMNSNIAPGTKGEMIEALWFERFVLATKSDSKENVMTVKEYSISPLLSPTQAELHECLISFNDIELRWCSKDSMVRHLLNACSDIPQISSHSAIFLRPHESTMMAIDGILITRLKERICVFYLQATIADNHPTSENASKYLDSLVIACGDIIQALIFILPKHRFLSWTRQIVWSNAVSASLPQYAILPGVVLSASDISSKKRSATQ